MALHSRRWDIKRLFCPTTEVGRKDKWRMQEPGPAYRKFSMHETHRVTHLVMIMFTEEVKDTVTLLLFYLLVIWECSVLPVGNVFFQAAVQRRPGCGSGAAGGSPQRAGGRRRPKDGAAQPGTLELVQLEAVMHSRSTHFGCGKI